ncbi:MAG TPA: NDP-hexose 2,3-dehydratase family protein [Phnomibacter sp.]|nr:NDP-hexose 2,3-dehydratase family protein [Phnomibacter sp.]
MTLREQVSITLLRSVFTEDNPFNSTVEVLNWVRQRNNEVSVQVDRIGFDELEGWSFVNNGAALAHRTGKFFSIEGISVQTNWGLVSSWQQPIINQPEVGFLGILAKEFNGVLYFLLQAKIEPGNVNVVQLSPTLQATKSNYTQVHGGKKPAYLDYFKDAQPEQILFDQLQSEQGARFLQKRNRNLIILTNEEIEVGSDFIWLTLGQIKELMKYDNLVNMDARTVISGIHFKVPADFPLSAIKHSKMGTAFFKSYFQSNFSEYSFDDLIAWITKLKCKYELNIEKVPLSKVSKWVIEPRQIRHENDKFFRVIAARVAISNREVTSWCQPLIEPVSEGLIAFLVKNIDGMLHFLVQAKLECGNFDILELAPTVQTITGDYRNPEYEVPFLKEVLSAKPENILYDCKQSEEGGRFYHEQNRNMIVMLDDDYAGQIPEHYTWMTGYQLQTFLKFNNYLNIQARTLLACIRFI